MNILDFKFLYSFVSLVSDYFHHRVYMVDDCVVTGHANFVNSSTKFEKSLYFFRIENLRNTKKHASELSHFLAGPALVKLFFFIIITLKVTIDNLKFTVSNHGHFINSLIGLTETYVKILTKIQNTAFL